MQVSDFTSHPGALPIMNSVGS